MKILTASIASLAVAVTAIAAVGCSSSSSSGGSRSGVAESKTIATLTDADRKQLCDWVAAQSGGYGHKTTKTCDGGLMVSETATKDQATCVAGLASAPATCMATVQQAEDCINAQLAADLCSLTDTVPAACQSLNTPSCQGGTTADAG